jgi:hypothetical protein
MAKLVRTGVLDLALNQIKNNDNRQVICSSQPVVYADLNTYKLAEVAMAAGDYTLANGDTSGRKVTMGAKSGIAVATSGTATHDGLGDSVNSNLDLVTTVTSQAINTGGTVDIPAWKYEIQNPT